MTSGSFLIPPQVFCRPCAWSLAQVSLRGERAVENELIRRQIGVRREVLTKP